MRFSVFFCRASVPLDLSDTKFVFRLSFDPISSGNTAWWDSVLVPILLCHATPRETAFLWLIAENLEDQKQPASLHASLACAMRLPTLQSGVDQISSPNGLAILAMFPMISLLPLDSFLVAFSAFGPMNVVKLTVCDALRVHRPLLRDTAPNS